MSDDGANVPDDVMREERALREQGIREASQTLERIARQAAKRENPSLAETDICLLYTSPSPRDATLSRMPSSA